MGSSEYSVTISDSQLGRDAAGMDKCAQINSAAFVRLWDVWFHGLLDHHYFIMEAISIFL